MESLPVEAEKKLELDDSGCVQDDVSPRPQPRVQLLDFSDDVLLSILEYCTPRELKAVGFTCERLNILIRDRTLWHSVDARREPSGTGRFRWYLANVLHADTRELHLCGHEKRAHGCFHLSSYIEKHYLKCKGRMNDETFDKRIGNPYLKPQVPNDVSNNHCPLRGNSEDNDKVEPQDLKIYREVDNKDETSDNNNKTEELLVKLAVTPKMLKKLHISCPNLEFLSLEYCKLDCRMTGISMFPKNLKKLSLRGVQCVNPPVEKGILFKIHDHLPVLEYLDLSECEWMEAVGLLPLSKMPKLKALIMQHCHKLNEFVAYASLAARYGFLSLEVVDLRFSPVCDSEVSAFGWLPELRELYLQCASSKGQGVEEQDLPLHSIPEEADVSKAHSDWEASDIVESDDEDDPNNMSEETRDPDQCTPLNLTTWNRQEVFVIHNGPTAEIINVPFANDRIDYRRTIEAVLPRRRNPPLFNPDVDLPRLGRANITVRRIPNGGGDASDNGNEDNQIPGPSRDDQIDDGDRSIDVLAEESDNIIELNDNVLVVNLSQGLKRRADVEASNSSNRMEVDVSTSDSTSKRQKLANEDAQPGPSNATAPNVTNSESNVNEPSGSKTHSSVGVQTNENVNIVVDVPNTNDRNAPSTSNSQNGINNQNGAGQQQNSPNQNGDNNPRQRFVRFSLNDNAAPANNRLGRPRMQPCSIRDFFRRHDHRVQMVLGHGSVPVLRHLDSTAFVDQSTYVSDSSIRHFGESQMGDIDYVNIGSALRRKCGESTGRPCRSNLRVLSVRGYRHVTDRSLNHLLTAAPYLVRIDFRETGVTEAGVERFRSLRPDVEVLYSKKDENK